MIHFRISFIYSCVFDVRTIAKNKKNKMKNANKKSSYIRFPENWLKTNKEIANWIGKRYVQNLKYFVDFQGRPASLATIFDDIKYQEKKMFFFYFWFIMNL